MAFFRNFPETRQRKRILFLQVVNPAAYPPLINAACLAADAGWEVMFLSSSVVGSNLTLPRHGTIAEVSAPDRPTFRVSPLAFADYCRRALVIAQNWRPDVVYASDHLGALPGLLATKVSGARLIYHEHDSPNRQDDLNPLFRFARQRVVKQAEQIVFPNAERGAHAQRELRFTPERLHIVWNMPRLEELPIIPDRISDPLIIYYHGNVSADLVPFAAAEAVARLGGAAVLRIAGYESPSGYGHVASLKRQFGDRAQGGVIEYLGEIPRENLLSTAAQAHVGLALMPFNSGDINVRNMAGASNKAFDYMAAGLALLVSDLPEWRETYVEPGYALAVDAMSTDSIEAALRKLVNDPALRISMAARSRLQIERQWNYDNVFPTLLQLGEV